VKRQASTIGYLDVFIASIAMTNGESLVTRNIRHFERVPGLKVENW
jgi:tRNA(fMet)-specific endonuclease VapC